MSGADTIARVLLLFLTHLGLGAFLGGAIGWTSRSTASDCVLPRDAFPVSLQTVEAGERTWWDDYDLLDVIAAPIPSTGTGSIHQSDGQLFLELKPHHDPTSP
ncbi:MAG: hypothetical protein KC621_34795 [Myxococcales bacterium]|nr:hypothetical protein [Myxococcales bacterium]